MNKRITIVATSIVAYDRRILRIAKTLARHGYIIEIISRNLDTNGPFTSPFFKHKRIKMFTKNGILFYVEFNIRLFIKLLSSKYDCLYAVDLDTFLPSCLHSILRNKRLIFDSHEFFTEVPELAGKKYKKSFWTYIGKIGTRRSHLNITVNDTLSAALEAKYKVPFTVIKNLPSLYKIMSTRDVHEPRTLIYVGVLNEGRGIEELLKVVQLEPDLKLILIGEGDLYHHLVATVKHLGIKDRVTFTGWILPHDLMLELEKGDIGINVLDPKSESYRKSLANKTFDYIQAELPSIQMNFTTYQQLNQSFKTSILIDHLEVEEIRIAVNLLREDRPLYKSLVANCRQAKEVWNWETEQKKLIAAIEDII